jgi:sterol 24-C-methyltransferase
MIFFFAFVLFLYFIFKIYINNRSLLGKAVLRDKRINILKNYNNTYGEGIKWKGKDCSISKKNNKDSAEQYFTITTEFLEWGWGDAIHMAPMHPNKTFKQSMNMWEIWFSNRIGIKEGLKIADLGMGIGGPMRRISEFMNVDITGITICKYQIERANKLTPNHLKDKCHYLEGDYSDTKLPSNSFDIVYFMESLSHCQNREKPLAEAYRILKPGGVIAAWQWMLTDKFDYNNSLHREYKRAMEYGGGLRNLNKPNERIKEFKKAGFNVIEESIDMMEIAEKMGWKSWIIPIDKGHDNFTRFASSNIGRKITTIFSQLLENVGIAKKGTTNIAKMMEHCAVGATKAGKIKIFTPMWLTISRKKK